MDLDDPDHPLFCPRATLYGAVMHVAQRGQTLAPRDAASAVILMLNAFRGLSPLYAREDEYVKARLDSISRLAVLVLVGDASHVADS